MFVRDLKPMFLMDEGDPAGGTPPATPPGTDPNAGGTPAGDPPTPPADKTFNQAEVDRIVKERLDRDRKTREEEARKAAMTEAEKLKAEKDEADKRSQATTDAANLRAVKADAKIALRDKGVTAEKVDRALRMLDLDGIKVGDDGEPDAKAITAAVDALLKDIPELAGTSGDGKGGGDIGGGGGKGEDLTDEKIAKMSSEEYAKNLPAITAHYKRKQKPT